MVNSRVCDDFEHICADPACPLVRSAVKTFVPASRPRNGTVQDVGATGFRPLEVSFGSVYSPISRLWLPIFGDHYLPVVEVPRRSSALFSISIPPCVPSSGHSCPFGRARDALTAV